MGTRLCPCVRLRSRARADVALMRGMCASAARSLRNASDGTRTGIAYSYMMHACIYIHVRLATSTNGSPRRARRTHAPMCCVRARVRVRLGAHASVPTRASAFRRRGSRVARLAGVLLGVGVQRQHRRMEYRIGHHVVLCMRRFRPAMRNAAAALGRSSMTRGS
jgi:hypothetical protein